MGTMLSVFYRSTRRRRGITLPEMILFLTMLAVAGGASIFFFLLSSRDMAQAKERQVWEREVHAFLDSLHEELKHAAAVETPFSGESRECFYRRTVPSGSLEPSLQQEGFMHADETLVHVTRSAQGISARSPFSGKQNPLLGAVKKCVFRRPSGRLLEVEVVLTPPDDPEASEVFRRSICLRNE